MPLVDWSKFIPADAKVLYSTLDTTGQPEDKDIAAIKLSDGFVIDIEWRHQTKMYVVSEYRVRQNEDFRIKRHLLRCWASSARRVCQIVKTWSHKDE